MRTRAANEQLSGPDRNMPRKQKLKNLIARVSHKARVQRRLPDAYCVKLNAKIEHYSYIIWPGKIQPRGFERPAIALGRTAAEAWKSIKFYKPPSTQPKDKANER